LCVVQGGSDLCV